jgi:glycosyltransferase involved in cell wall biosynthesis
MSASKNLSVIVPIYNEEKTIVTLMQKLVSAVPDAEIIYVNDGSTDQSLALVRQHARPEDKVLTKDNGGKGSAVRHGLMQARGEYTIIQDADLEYEPADINRLLQAAQEGGHDAVLGSRRLQKQDRRYARLKYYIGGVLLNTIFNVLNAGRLTDMNTCYKLVRTSILQSFPLRENGFGLDAEIVSHLARRKINIHEIGISYMPRSAKEGKKITGWHFFHLLWVLIRVRLERV